MDSDESSRDCHFWATSQLRLADESHHDPTLLLSGVLREYSLRKQCFMNAEVCDKKRLAYALVNFCLRHNIECSRLVVKVLQCVWEMLGSFALIYNRKSLWSCDLDVDYYTEQECDNVPIISYFLRHSNKCRMTFDGKRFVDQENCLTEEPIVRAISDKEPKKVALLLRHGCQIKLRYGFHNGLNHKADNMDFYVSETSRRSIVPYKSCCRSLLFKEVRHCFKILFDAVYQCGQCPPSSDSSNSETDDFTTVQDTVSILQLLLRSVRRIGPELVVYATPAARGHYFERYKQALEFSEVLKEMGYLTTLSERFHLPATLKHQCRFRVREILRKNWALPDGINLLNIPRTLQAYLDLKED